MLRLFLLAALAVLISSPAALAQSSSAGNCTTGSAENFEIGLRIDGEGLADIDIDVIDTRDDSTVSFSVDESSDTGSGTGCAWVAHVSETATTNGGAVAEMLGNVLYTLRFTIDPGTPSEVVEEFSYFFCAAPEAALGEPQPPVGSVYCPYGVAESHPDLLFFYNTIDSEFRIVPLSILSGTSTASVDDYLGQDWVLPLNLRDVCEAAGTCTDGIQSSTKQYRDTQFLTRQSSPPFTVTRLQTEAFPLNHDITNNVQASQFWTGYRLNFDAEDVASLSFAPGQKLRTDDDGARLDGVLLTADDASQGWRGISVEAGYGGTGSFLGTYTGHLTMLGGATVEKVGGYGTWAVTLDNTSLSTSTAFINSPVPSSITGGLRVTGADAEVNAFELTIAGMTGAGVSANSQALVRLTSSAVQNNSGQGLVAGYLTDSFLYPALNDPTRAEGVQLTGNAGDGVRLTSSADVLFGYGYYPAGASHNDGFNSVTGSTGGDGVDASSYATLYAGNHQYWQRNRLFGNAAEDARATGSGTTVQARCNWWNDLTPPFRTMAQSGATLDDSFWLLQDPYVDPDAECTSHGIGSLKAGGTAARSGEGSVADRVAEAFALFDRPAEALAALSLVVAETPQAPEAAGAVQAVARLASLGDAPGAEATLALWAESPFPTIRDAARVGLVSVHHRAEDRAAALGHAESLAGTVRGRGARPPQRGARARGRRRRGPSRRARARAGERRGADDGGVLRARDRPRGPSGASVRRLQDAERPGDTQRCGRAEPDRRRCRGIAGTERGRRRARGTLRRARP